MKFLDKLGFTKSEINEIENNTPTLMAEKIKQQQKLVTANILFLKELGVTNYTRVFINYYDMFLMDNSNFINIFNQYDRDDLIDKIQKDITVIEYL
ncbi:MAG: hypothetical protein J6B98_03395 [Bacilli bacterium]|nr:hypothetical protein [Bacilli bacterium]